MVESLTGIRFGKLTVISLVGVDKYYDKLWFCKCDCGNEVVVKQGHLRSGHTTSCGCNKNLLKSLVGQQFGELTVISRAEDYVTPKNGKKYAQWNCLCSCGKMTVVLTNNLKTGSIKSCGHIKESHFENLEGHTFGKLRVIRLVEPYINPNGRKLVRYECECECGAHVLELANTLRNGDVTSCGCSVNSKGERFVKRYLDDHHISYVQHKSFDDCLSDNGFKLNFDFYISDLNVLIECQGLQHFEPVAFFGGEERFCMQQKYDAIKSDYALTHNIRYLVLDCRRECLKNLQTNLDEFFATIS